MGESLLDADAPRVELGDAAREGVARALPESALEGLDDAKLLELPVAEGVPLVDASRLGLMVPLEKRLLESEGDGDCEVERLKEYVATAETEPVGLPVIEREGVPWLLHAALMDTEGARVPVVDRLAAAVGEAAGLLVAVGARELEGLVDRAGVEEGVEEVTW